MAHLTDDQRDEFTRLFQRYDDDGDGRIDRHELRAALLSTDQPLHEDAVDATLAALDDDGDGTLDLDEFLAGMAAFLSRAP